MLLKLFGKQLKDKRESLGITQIQLSEQTGVYREQISRIENGQINPTLETIFKLSYALEIPLKELFDFQIGNIQFKEYKVKPFVKWAGGKTQLLNELKSLMPKKFDTYYEPFLGGGALFFSITPEKAILSDFNKELINAYKVFQKNDFYNKMIEELIKHETNHNEDYYYQIREMDRSENYNDLPEYIRAARLIYLNKSCFNGLYRVNSKGYFNVPSGKKDKVKTFDQNLFDNIHEYLSNSDIKFLSKDFEDVTKTAKQGDFVYFDPPYDTFEGQDNFTTYTKNSFGKDEQARLAKVFRELDKKGVQLMLSNHNTPFINELYEGYNISIVKARRSINSNASKRGKIEEVIITNY